MASVGFNKDIYAVTGDGSLDPQSLNSHLLNIKIFVINNGGYVSMINWQDNIFMAEE